MRNTRVRAIHTQEIHNPLGMSSATFRAAKRRYSQGINRVPKPKPISPVGHLGFPTNTVQTIKTWTEKQPRNVTITDNVWEHAKGGILKLKKSRKRTSVNRMKFVTRVISRPKPKAK